MSNTWSRSRAAMLATSALCAVAGFASLVLAVLPLVIIAGSLASSL